MVQGATIAPHGIECPKCGRHTVISVDSNIWKCLNCDFFKDFSKEKENKNKKKTNWIQRAYPLKIINFVWKFINNIFLDKNVFLVFPEDWRGNLESKHKRLLKTNVTKGKIRCELCQMCFGMFWGTLQSKVENIWLPKRKTDD